MMWKRNDSLELCIWVRWVTEYTLIMLHLDMKQFSGKLTKGPTFQNSNTGVSMGFSTFNTTISSNCPIILVDFLLWEINHSCAWTRGVMSICILRHSIVDYKSEWVKPFSWFKRKGKESNCSFLLQSKCLTGWVDYNLCWW